MKTTTIMKSMILAVACLSSVAFAACSDDDDNNNTSKLTFSKSSVQVKVGSTDTLKVANGTQAYKAKSSSDAIATVTTVKDSIFVKGVKAGTATIVVTDSKNVTGSFSATVKK